MADDQTQTAPPPPPGYTDDVPAASAKPQVPTSSGWTDPSISGPQVPFAGVSQEDGDAYQAAQSKIDQHTQPGKLMTVVNRAFGLDEPLGISSETTQALRDAGIFNDPAKFQANIFKTFNEAVIRPASMIGDAAFRGVNAVTGLPVAGVDAALNPRASGEQLADDADSFNQDLSMVMAASPEAFGSLSSGGVAEETKAAIPPSARQEITVAPKPWQAEIPAVNEEGVAAEAKAPSPPPITNLPAIGSPEAKAAESAVPSRPTDPINHENPILDGSGNLNLDYIKADSDTKQVMADTAEAYAQRYGNVVSHAETTEQANAYFDEALKSTTNGMPDELLNYQRNGPLNSDSLWMARQVSVQLANQFAKLSKVATATGAPEDAEAAKDMFARMVQMVGPVRHEMTATAGRTLNSMQIPVGEEAQQGGALTEQAFDKLSQMNVDDAMKIAGTLETPQQVAKFVTDVQKPSFTDMGMYYVFNNYLSGPLTHVAYTTSWALQTAIRAGIETPIAAAVGKAQEMLGKTLAPEELEHLTAIRNEQIDKLAAADRGELKMTAIESQEAQSLINTANESIHNAMTVMPGEAKARFFGVAQGAMDSIKAFGRALKTSDVQMLPGEMQKAEDAAKAAEAKALEAGKTPEYAKAAGQAAYQDSATNFGNPIVQYGKMIKNPAGSATVQALGQVVGAPMRVIAALHSLQKFSGYSESMNALAYRQAATEGLAGDELANRIAVLKNNPPPEMMQAAIKESKYAALMGESGDVGKKFQTLANANAWTRTVVPFSKVVTNLTSQKLLERTPLGLLSKVVKGNIMGENGNAAQATQIAKMLTGSTLLMGGAYLAARGTSFGYGSDDKNERAFNYLQGKQPYSVNIGGLNLPHRFFGVAGGSLSLGADVHDVYQGVTEADGFFHKVQAAVGGAIHYVGRDIMSENALTGPAELYNAIDDKEGAAKHYVPNAIAAAAVPYSSFQSQINSRFIDPIMRQTMSKDSYESLAQTIQSRSFWSRDMTPKIDILGNPMQRNSDHSWAEKDSVMQALQYHHVFPSAVESKLFGVDLDQKQFADYATLAGKSFDQALRPQVSAPGWVKLNDKQQMEVITNAVKTSRAQARATMSLLYPGIIKDAAAKKVGLLHQYDSLPAQGAEPEDE